MRLLAFLSLLAALAFAQLPKPSGLSGSGVPSGPAGGDLSGTYPDPTLAYKAVNPQTGTSYGIVTADRQKLITFANANPIAVTIAQAGSAGFPDGWEVWLLNSGVGTVTVTPAVSTIEGAATLVLTTNKSARIISNGTNYRAVRTPVPPGNRVVTTTPDPIVEADDGKWVIYNSAGATAVTLACPSATGFVRGWITYVKNANVGTVTITVPGPCYFDNPLPITTIVMPAGQGAIIESDGTNFYTQKTSGAGTSGGIPYFSDFYTQSSSGVLASGYIVVGGGAGGAPTTSSLSASNAAVGSFSAVFDGGGSALSAGAVAYTRIPFSCTITGYSIVADTGTATVDVWKIATGTALPTNANTITGGQEPALAVGNALKSTTIDKWTTAVGADDIAGFNIDAVASATWLQVMVYCNKT